MESIAKQTYVGNIQFQLKNLCNKGYPPKEKIYLCKQWAVYDKALRKEHKHQTRLCNKYHKNRTDENLKAVKKQRNKCVKLLRKAKYDDYQNIRILTLVTSRVIEKNSGRLSYYKNFQLRSR